MFGCEDEVLLSYIVRRLPNSSENRCGYIDQICVVIIVAYIVDMLQYQIYYECTCVCGIDIIKL